MPNKQNRQTNKKQMRTNAEEDMGSGKWLTHCGWEYQLEQQLSKSVYRILKELEMEHHTTSYMTLGYKLNFILKNLHGLSNHW